jgi:exosortase H (IPTLxxWG-CTERM-specific)
VSVEVGGDAPSKPEHRRVPGRYGHVVRAWVYFVVGVGVLVQVLIWARPFTDTTLCRWVATATVLTLRSFGIEARAEGTVIQSSLGSIEIVRECTAAYPTAMYWAAVLAYPCTLRRKLIGAAVGALAIQVINLARVVSLCCIHKWYPQIFETAHLVVWQSLIVFFTLLIWIIWATGFSGARRSHAT